jgi:hypothetical protein
MSVRTRWVRSIAVVAVTATAMVGCSDDDDDDAAGSAPPSTGAPAATGAPAVTTPAVSATEVTTPTETTFDTLPATSAAATGATTPGVAPGGYEEVGADQLLPLGADGKSDPIADPLGDGVYYAIAYSPTDDGSVRFDLARFISAETCIDELDTVPGGTVDQQGCYGGVEDTDATASVTMPLDGATPVILVTQDFRFFRVTAAEFARLLAGEAPAPDAPPGFEYQPYWRAMVEVVDGEVARANQQPSS